MKKLFMTVSILTILLFASTAMAAPYLQCDPDPNCQTYEVYEDTVLVVADAPAPLNHDLVTMPVAGINYTAKCCNYRDCSEVSDSFLSLDDPLKPMNLKLAPLPLP